MYAWLSAWMLADQTEKKDSGFQTMLQDIILPYSACQ